ncbi:MAG: threonine-phosphate decarboxylase CobD [Pseudomonadota bacterium]
MENLDQLVSGHGGRIDIMAAAFPQAPLPWIDLSTGINPFAYPLPPIPDQAWIRLPTIADREACEHAMAEAFGCDPAYCRAVSGTELVIRQIPSILGGHRVAIRECSYADHRESWADWGSELVIMDNPLDAAAEVDAVVLVNPNNPDGQRWPSDRIETARSKLAARGGWLILDEAYADLDPDSSMAAKVGREGFIILRSFGKFFGLAGLRLGAVLAPPDILSELDDKLGGWNVSGPALMIGTTAYSDLAWQSGMRHKLAQAALDLSQILKDADMEEVGGTDLFRFVRVPDAVSLWIKLAEQGISVRRFAADNQHLRIGIPHSQGVDRLARALSL